MHRLDDMEFGRRLAIEREMERDEGELLRTANAVWDETGNFVLYPTLLGIKGGLGDSSKMGAAADDRARTQSSTSSRTASFGCWARTRPRGGSI